MSAELTCGSLLLANPVQGWKLDFNLPTLFFLGMGEGTPPSAPSLQLLQTEAWIRVGRLGPSPFPDA